MIPKSLPPDLLDPAVGSGFRKKIMLKSSARHIRVQAAKIKRVEPAGAASGPIGRGCEGGIGAVQPPNSLLTTLAV